MRQHKINIHALDSIKIDIQTYSPHPPLVNVIAVTKTFNYTSILSAKENQLLFIGENKVQEFLLKKNEKPNIDRGLETHLIGHLQSNKVKKAVGLFNVIQTVDSFKIAQKINNKAKEKNLNQKIYIQINIGSDPNKYGFILENIYSTIDRIEQYHNLHLVGLMTILPFYKDITNTQPLFAHMKEIQLKVLKDISPTCKFLSMGMSRDYVYALKEGATHLRIGTKLYGQRT